MSNMQRSPSDVVTISGLLEALDKGWQLHITCQQDAELRGSAWHGSWYFVVVSPDESEWAVLITARDLARERQRAKKEGRPVRRSPGDISYRDVKTASGVASLLGELGYTVSAYPTKKGDSIALPLRARAQM